MRRLQARILSIVLVFFCSCSFNAPDSEPGEEIPAPFVSSVSPVDGETAVSVIPGVAVVFSEPVEHIGAQLAFSLSEGGAAAGGIFSWDDNTMFFQPDRELKDFTTYIVKVLGGMVTNASGKVMLDSFQSSFTTGIDTHPPRVVGSIPEDQTIDVCPKVEIELAFSEPVDTSAVQQAFTLSCGGSPVSGQFNWNGNTMRFQPDDTLTDRGTYNIHLTRGATDDSNNPIPAEIDISFTVGVVIDIAAGNLHSIVAMSGGTVRAWGYNSYGQVGEISGNYITVPVSVAGVTDAVDVAAGRYHSVALLSDGTILCWGLNDEGQLGNGTNSSSATPVPVSGITNAIAVSCGVSDYLPEGGNHTLALLSDGTVVAWGSNDFGQLGNASTVDSNVPVFVSGINNVVAIAAGGHHSLAVLADGTIKAWGRNRHGALGNSSVDDSSTPVTVGGITNAVSVAAGTSHSLALLADNSVKGWGNSSFGQLGPSLPPPSWVWSPITIQLMPYRESVAAGADYSAIVMDDHTIDTWGTNLYGQLGTGDISERDPFPSRVPGIDLAVKVDGGRHHTLALLSDGAVMAWGRNSEGELGDGTRTNSSSPVAVIGF
jgi:alpha-tubulin suppressor-like RCC1 family protein